MTTLLIMAAGLGSRFGGGLKQFAPVGPSGEMIVDYSIHDAIKAGFGKLVFVIRREIEADFRVAVGDRLQARTDCVVEYVFQDIDDLPDGFTIPDGRRKPWGTVQAVLAAQDVIHEPFAVINADDYYGKEAFVQLHRRLTDHPDGYCMVGFPLEHTLSQYGSVKRGICELDAEGNLQRLKEREVSTADAEPTAIASMNIWGFPPGSFDILAQSFVQFLRDCSGQAECLLPDVIDRLVTEGRISVKVLHTRDKWLGITYREDLDTVTEGFRDLVNRGAYPSPL